LAVQDVAKGGMVHLYRFVVVERHSEDGVQGTKNQRKLTRLEIKKFIDIPHVDSDI
jgi:hypothetical protein